MTTAAQEVRRAPACAFCRRRLGGEYFFTCLRCEESYCYIHMSRHQPPACARRRRGAPRVAPVRGGDRLLLAGRSSANA